MAYTITLTNGTVLTTIANATVDNTTSLTLIGQNYSGYGQYIANDLVHVLENFSNTTAPSVPLVGQLWYNSTTQFINVYNGSAWVQVGININAGGDLTGTYPNPTVKTSVGLTGVPTAPTASFGTNTTQIATTAFVIANTLNVLQADLNLYVSTSGSDTNPGTIGEPFLTLQHAWNYIVSNINANGYNITINVANGTYTDSLFTKGMPVGASEVYILGNSGIPADVIITVTNGPAFAISYAQVSIIGFTIEASGSAGDFFDAGYGIVARLNGTVEFNNIIFGACGTAQIAAFTGGYITVSQASSTYTINGDAPTHAAANGGEIVFVDGTITLTGTPAFSYFAESTFSGLVQAYNTTFVGSATGARYSVQANGVLNTNGGGASYLPGNSVGSVNSGGQYI